MELLMFAAAIILGAPILLFLAVVVYGVVATIGHLAGVHFQELFQVLLRPKE